MDENQIYNQLRQEIDERSFIRFPKTETGEEIEILKYLYAPEEAQIAIHLSALPESVKRIHKRLQKNNINIQKDKLGEILEDLFQRGIILSYRHINSQTSKKKYELVHFAIGFYDFQIDRITKEFAESAEKYHQGEYYKTFHRKDGNGQLRIVPVEKSLTPEHHAIPYENIRQIIENKQEKIAIANCICKQSKDLLEDPCKMGELRSICTFFGTGADLTLEQIDSAREISKEELLTLLEKYQEVGYVIQVENCQDPQFMCMCCGCCCFILRGAKQFPKPMEYYKSNYYAQINQELCIGCGNCVNRCQMDAFTINDGKSSINLDRCIGCGNCIMTCEEEAIKLKEQEKIFAPIKTHAKLFLQFVKNKYGTLGTLKMLCKYLIGKKI